MSERKNVLGRISDFDIRLLRVFATVVECGGFTAAEVPLGIGRSAISVHMSDLEARIGLTLCRRGRSGFALTEEGREVHRAALELFAALGTFRDGVNDLHAQLRGELDIGITDNLLSMPQMRVTEALARLKRSGPEVRINISMIPPNEVELGVLDGRLDVGVLPWIAPIGGLDYLSLYEERSNLYCASTHPLFGADDDQECDLLAYDAVAPSYAVSGEVRARYAGLNATASASDREGVAFLILTGCYIGFLPDHMAEPWVARGLLRSLAHLSPGFDTSFVAATRKGREPGRVLERFLSGLRAS
ncbi:LysR family transcriptional regulator [Halotalea alkalilenta]|uniref:LysR family transcriptional regulator n=1 Tax=Halotalea alkalilenta TaxID=376489 RepID=A0A172YDZ7_9GAMM|nr:LysR family transcriptional regulator [Halotalea alkalilenta]ANF57478.1 LysR family transcriptional regulator [Halotalea alkalilenta]